MAQAPAGGPPPTMREPVSLGLPGSYLAGATAAPILVECPSPSPRVGREVPGQSPRAPVPSRPAEPLCAGNRVRRRRRRRRASRELGEGGLGRGRGRGRGLPDPALRAPAGVGTLCSLGSSAGGDTSRGSTFLGFAGGEWGLGRKERLPEAAQGLADIPASLPSDLPSNSSGYCCCCFITATPASVS